MSGARSLKSIKEHNDITEGHLNLKDASKAVQSWFRLHLFLEACKILDIQSIDGRREAIAAHPETYRDELKIEVVRLWEERH